MGVTLGKTVLQRRDRLEQIINPVPGIQVGGHVENRGKDLFQPGEGERIRRHYRKAQDQHLPTRKAITGLVED